MDAAKFFPPENTTSAFYKFSIVRENSAQRQRHKKKNQGVTENKIKQSKKKKRSDNSVLSQQFSRLLLRFHGFHGSLETSFSR